MQYYEPEDVAAGIAPDLIDSLDEARDIVRGLLPSAEHQEAEAIAWSLWQIAASGGWRA